MKNKSLYCILVSMITIAVNLSIIAQEIPDTPSEFPIGVFVDSDLFNDDEAARQTLYDLGINYVVQEARQHNKQYLTPFNLIASNARSPQDVIYHYTNGIYNKWDAERDDPNINVTGIKHAFYPGTSTPKGAVETYKGAVCWSTGTLTDPVDSLIYGPNYYQEKKYNRLMYIPYWGKKIDFRVRYRIAFENIAYLPGNTEVCRLYIRHGVNKLREDGWYSDEYIYTELAERTLTVSDFPTDDFYVFEVNYSYPDSLVPIHFKFGDGIPSNTSSQYADDIPHTGIEFCVDWRGVGKLYVDYVKVVDVDIGIVFIENSHDIKAAISNYLNEYTDWDNLKYWYVRDEPHSMDYYYPLRTVQGWVDTLTNGKQHTITEFYPNWNGVKNGDLHIQKYVELAQPKTLMIDYYPFTTTVPVPDYLVLLRGRLQESAEADPKFWYVGQGFGLRRITTNN